jgi:pimeloyl-ACP methyl ester carboxylesterase
MTKLTRRGAVLAPAALLTATTLPALAQPTPDGGRLLDVDGARLWFSVRGDGPVVLLLHGGLGHSGWMEGIAEALLPARRVIALDTRGMGRSTLGPRPLSYARQAADARTVLAFLGVREFDLIGFSDGGIVGYRLAAEGAGVRRLLTIGSRWSAENGRGMWDQFAQWNRASLSAGPFRFIVDDYDRLSPDRDLDRMMRQAEAMWRDDGPDGHPGAAMLDRIVQPVLVSVGDRDPFLSVANAEAARARLRQGALFVAPGAGHPVHNDRPDLFLPALRRFLETG